MAPEDSELRAAYFGEGEIVVDRYRIQGMIGRGGMGEVYEARDLLLDERIALKTVRLDRAFQDGARHGGADHGVGELRFVEGDRSPGLLHLTARRIDLFLARADLREFVGAFQRRDTAAGAG